MSDFTRYKPNERVEVYWRDQWNEGWVTSANKDGCYVCGILTTNDIYVSNPNKIRRMWWMTYANCIGDKVTVRYDGKVYDGTVLIIEYGTVVVNITHSFQLPIRNENDIKLTTVISNKLINSTTTTTTNDKISISTETIATHSTNDKELVSTDVVVTQSKLNNLSNEIKSAALRFAVDKSIEISCSYIIRMLPNNLFGNQIKNYLDSSFGKALIAYIIGNAILVSNSNNFRLQILGEELRVFGLQNTYSVIYSNLISPISDKLIDQICNFIDE